MDWISGWTDGLMDWIAGLHGLMDWIVEQKIISLLFLHKVDS